ncbi:MAG: bifunctional glutamate N-acetyltransferase/amino-acid acetyltransferase ArgJ [Deltaproteobacteria bacterium]|nr:bifunctional glutamate N-acetyltransferase/amino-acid acetyltransferase ArgJ [Deltaproteobacteria bacterium]
MHETRFTVKGFKAAAVAAGLKKNGGLDLALIFSEQDAAAAGVFTTNKVKAAPVILSKEFLQNGTARAIIANSGNANACTGISGLDNARKTAGITAEALGVRSDEVLTASTGVIGEPLKTDLIANALPGLVDNLAEEGLYEAARAIMTTDSFPKIAISDGLADGRPYRILGIAKGAGMIMPNMATMLCFIISDIKIEPRNLKSALLASVETTFNRITVDGDTSTNDMALVLANGMAGNRSLSSMEYNDFVSGLKHVMGDLSRMIVRDGEGATKLIDIVVRGAHSQSDALIAARTVANSSLVKTAFYGQDPNWGRIAAALGRSGIVMEENKLDIWIDDIQIVAMGLGKGTGPEKDASGRMSQKEFSLTVDLNQGKYEDRMVTCDLTHEYVTINANYRT